ncbi:MAG TPA: hypothetical protein VH681_04275 [Nitrospiraceae bacterium]|jgi:hypothetical protein
MHIIRLRGPWEVEPIWRYELPLSGRRLDFDPRSPTKQKMPSDWGDALGRDFLGCVRYRRRFHAPTNLTPQDFVWLVVEPPRSVGTVELNGHYLGNVEYDQPEGRFEVMSLLREANELLVYVSHPALDPDGNRPQQDYVNLPGGLVGEVRLEIKDQ